MLYKGLLCIFIYLLLSSIAFAKSTSNSCVLLGSQASLIIKFKNISSAKQPELNKNFVRKLSTASASVTALKAMSGDAYILFFTPKQLLISEQIEPGCYSNSSIDKLIQEIKLQADVEYVVPNIIMTIAGIKKFQVPVISAKQWNLLDPPGGIDAQTAFNTTTGNPNVFTAVLDTGVLTNDSLSPNLLSGVTFNNNGQHSNGASPSCDSTCQATPHGTHVSGIVATSGVLAYGEQIYGVAPNTKILPINVFTKFENPTLCASLGTTSPCLAVQFSDLTNALNWLHGENFSGLPSAPYVTTVNMSLGGTSLCLAPIQQALNLLLAKDINVCVAAGNSNADASLETPANCSGVMPIAATDRNGFGTYYSNFGTIVSFAAPGGDTSLDITNGIYSTVENGYDYMQGTSQASPHAAGLAALLYSLDPTLTSTGVLNLIQTTTTPFPSGGPGFSCTLAKPCGTGIINANLAVLATVAQAPILSWTPNLTVSVNNKTQATLTWQPAAWQPFRSTAIVYTVNKNTLDVSNCTNILATTCVLNNLAPNQSYTIFIKASDIRNIYGPLQSETIQFRTPPQLFAPTLTIAERNPLRNTQAFIYYSSIGSRLANAYTITGLIGAVVTLDSNHNRFIINNITTPRKINVTITAIFGNESVQSNEIFIPSII